MFNLLEISETNTKVSVCNSCLYVQCGDGSSRSISFNDLNAIILANPAMSLTGHVLLECGTHRVPVVCCDNSFSPVAVLTPIPLNGAEHDFMLEAQLDASKPFKKRLWKHIITAKIRGQSHVLLKERKDDSLSSLCSSVMSGDSGNIEAQAARVYWKSLDVFPRRDRLAQDANIFFNYVYTIVYSAFARYICSMALHPHLGIRHHNQYNPFCLASDLMEPFRPAADCVALALLGNTDSISLSRPNREFLIRHLYDCAIDIAGESCPLFSAVRRTALSFRQCLLQNNPDLIELPHWNISAKEA